MEPDPQPPEEDRLIGRTIAEKFRIEARVGKGAMGCVYRATQLNLKKTVAIKVLNQAPHAADPAFAHRFKREAKAASRLDHPNSLRVIDFGEDAGLLYIAMEYLQGRDLLAVLREEFPLTRERTVNILSQTLAALAVAHEMGVIHRDLKPENVMLLPSKDDEGSAIEVVKVCDFGIAKIVEADAVDHTGNPTGDPTRTATGTLTAHGMLIGTPEYMSPEQARGEPADARSDIYSLGVILYQMLSARLPFVATSKLRLVIKHVEELPSPPSALDSNVDLGLEAVCMRALEKRPEDRFQSAREMRAALRAALEARDGRRAPQSGPPSARPVPPPRDARPPSGRLVASGPQELPPAQRSSANMRSAMVSDIQPTASVAEDPAEAAAALVEARKLLNSVPPPAHASDPPRAAQAAPAPAAPSTPSRVPSAASILVGVVVLVAAIAYFALR